MKKVILEAETLAFLGREFPVLAGTLKFVADHSANVQKAKKVRGEALSTVGDVYQNSLTDAHRRLAKQLTKGD